MPAPIYTTDLRDITLAETVTGWTALGGGASGLGVGADFAMQGPLCVDKAITAAEKGQIFDFGTTIATGSNHFFIWIFLATPGLANTLALRGLTAVVGTSTTAYVQYHVEGRDTYGALGRVAKCYPIKYNRTANTGAPPYRTVTGTPGVAPQWFGGVANITGTVKGANLGVDAIRYGTGFFAYSGDSTTPITFSGSAAVNDATGSRWGLITYTSGVAYELQGKYTIGQTTSSVATQSYFSDTGKSILFVDTPHTDTDFSQVIIDHSASVVNMTSCAMVAGGTNNPGRIVYRDHRTKSELTACTFDRIGTSSLMQNVTSSGCTWNLAGDVIQSGSTMIGNNFTGTKVISDLPSNISNCTFTFGTAGRQAIEITRTGSYTFSGNKFIGFGPSGSLTASLYNNSGGVVTMSIQNGGDTPTFRNSPGSSTFISNPVSLTVNITDSNGQTVTSSCEVTIVRDSDTSILYADENVITGTTQYLYTYSTDTIAYINVMNVSTYEPKTVSPVTISSTDQTITIALDDERGKYSNT